MQQAAKFGRLVLMIAGLVLLVIFGMRAAQQAPSLAAVRGQPNRNLGPFSLGRISLAPSANSGSYALAFSAPPVATAAAQPPTDTHDEPAHSLQGDKRASYQATLSVAPKDQSNSPVK